MNVDIDNTASLANTSPQGTPLPEGNADYEIVAGKWIEPKPDQTFRAFLALSFRHGSTHQSHDHELNLVSDNEDQARIATATFADICKSVQITGRMTPERLPQLAGRWVNLTVAHRPNPNKPEKPYVNITNVLPFQGVSQAAAPAPAPAAPAPAAPPAAPVAAPAPPAPAPVAAPPAPPVAPAPVAAPPAPPAPVAAPPAPPAAPAPPAPPAPPAAPVAAPPVAPPANPERPWEG